MNKLKSRRLLLKIIRLKMKRSKLNINIILKIEFLKSFSKDRGIRKIAFLSFGVLFILICVKTYMWE